MCNKKNTLFVVVVVIGYYLKQHPTPNKKTKVRFGKDENCCCLGLFFLKRVIFFKFGSKAYDMVM